MGLRDILFRQQRRIEGLFGEYLDDWQKCVEGFAKAMRVYLAHGPNQEFDYLCESTHKSESSADDKRREIEFELYSKSLLPESRGDILGLLETIDKVINKVESVLFQIHLEQIGMPEIIAPHYERIVAVTNACLALVHKAAGRAFSPDEGIPELAEQIDARESECDHAERQALKALFQSDLPWHVKFQVKNLIIETGNITDRAETVADRLVITSVKRRV